MINNYLLRSPNLVLCFMLLDSRLNFQEIDKEFIEWCGENSIPILALVMTKTDGVKKMAFEENMNSISK
ncbi:MAG: hypothetical protein R2771_05545 [Saprospiraceae bacterium]